MCGTKLSQHTPSHRMCGTKLSLHEPHGPTSGTKLSLLAQNGSIWHFFYMQGEFYTEHEAELWLANRTPGPTCVEGAGGTGVEGTGGFRGTEPGRGASG